MLDKRNIAYLGDLNSCLDGRDPRHLFINYQNTCKPHAKTKCFFLSPCLSRILYGCETWTNITKQQIDKLEKIQKDALQRIFTIPRTTSRFGLYFECGSLPIEQRIIIRKLMYLKKILNMPDSRSVKIVYNEQKRLGMTKCWCNEVWTIIKNLGMTISEKPYKHHDKKKNGQT